MVHEAVGVGMRVEPSSGQVVQVQAAAGAVLRPEVAPGVGTPAAPALLVQTAAEGSAGVRGRLGSVLNVLSVDERARALQTQTAAEGPAGVRGRLGSVLSVDERLLWAHFLASFPVLAEECDAQGAAKGAGTGAERYAFEIARIAFPVQFAFAAELCGIGDG